jgi:hypothetical protein
MLGQRKYKIFLLLFLQKKQEYSSFSEEKEAKRLLFLVGRRRSRVRGSRLPAPDLVSS